MMCRFQSLAYKMKPPKDRHKFFTPPKEQPIQPKDTKPSYTLSKFGIKIEICTDYD